MANKIFRQVLCSERLPKEDGLYICSRNNVFSKIGLLLFNHEEASYWLSYVDYWLEEVELPSADEIEVIIDNLLIERGEHFSRVRNPLYGEERILAHNTFTKAIELIKGEGLNNPKSN